jgi:uncharacterized protein (DUF885 family)
LGTAYLYTMREQVLPDQGPARNVSVGNGRQPELRARFLLPVVLTLAISAVNGCALVVPPRGAPTPTDSAFARAVLATTLTTYWRTVLPRRPDLASAVTGTADALPVESLAEHRWPIQLSYRISSDLEAIDTEALSPREYATVEALQQHVGALAEEQAFFGQDLSVLSPEESALSKALTLLRNHSLAREGDTDRYLYLLESLAHWFLQARTALEEKWRQGSTPSRQVAELFLSRLESLRAGQLRSILALGGPRLPDLPELATAQFQQDAAEALDLRILPALDSLISFVRAPYLEVSRPEAGLWQLPGGKEYYRFLLRKHSGLEIDPEAAHGAGIAQLRRVDSILVDLRRRNRWNPSPALLHDSLRRAVAPGSSTAGVLQRMSELQQDLRSRLGDPFGGIDSSRVSGRVASEPESLLHPEGTVVFKADSSGGGMELVITSRWATPPALFELRSRIARLGWPGLANERYQALVRHQQPDFITFHASSAFEEGWGAYVAAVAGELGFFGDPVDAYAQLLHEALAAALLIVDTGVHYFGWTKIQALATLQPYTLLAGPELDSLFVARVAASPGRAGVEALALREMTALRSWMQQELGPAFNLRAWHTELLSLGPVALPILGTHLEWWAWERRRIAAQTPRVPEG